MSTTLTTERLKTLQNWPHMSTCWHFLSAVALSVSNRAEEIPTLYKYTLGVTKESEHEELTSKFREAILKSAGLIGLPRTIAGLIALRKVTPENLVAKKLLREDKTDYRKEANEIYDAVYTKDADDLREMLYDTYPDLNLFTLNFVYGPLFSCTKVLTLKETSFTIAAAITPQDVDIRLRGHLQGAVNNGATVAEANSVRDMVVELMGYYHHKFKNPVSRLSE